MFRFKMVALFFLCARPASGSVVQMYGSEFAFPAAFNSVNISDGSITRIGISNSFLSGMDFSPSGVLYAAGNEIVQVDPATGSASNRRPLTFIGAPSDIMSGLTFSPSGELFGIGNGNGNLWKIDLATANAQLIGTSATSAFSLEFGPGGKLYAAGFDLFELNPLNANATRIGLISNSPSSLITGMDFASDGVLYGVSSNHTSDVLFRINVLTGAGTFIGTTGGNLVSIASRPGLLNAIPEPSGFVIWSAGLMIGLLRFRARSIPLAC